MLRVRWYLAVPNVSNMVLDGTSQVSFFHQFDVSEAEAQTQPVINDGSTRSVRMRNQVRQGLNSAVRPEFHLI